jgi:hypothetical protein
MLGLAAAAVSKPTAAHYTALGKLSGATTQSNETLRLALKPLKLAHTNGHP